MIKINGKRIFLFIILGFIILNLSWLLITTVKYNKFVKAVPKNEHNVYSMNKEDGYSYHVKKPNYLHYTGNLTVSNHEKGELLIIWPLMSGGYKYGFMVVPLRPMLMRIWIQYIKMMDILFKLLKNIKMNYRRCFLELMKCGG